MKTFDIIQVLAEIKIKLVVIEDHETGTLIEEPILSIETSDNLKFDKFIDLLTRAHEYGQKWKMIDDRSKEILKKVCQLQ
jgi:hypothetical protein